MPRTFRELVKEIPIDVGKNKLSNEDLKVLITVELLAVGCELLDENLSLQESWVLFTGYNAPILPTKANLIVVANIRKYLIHATGKANIERLLKSYSEIPIAYRLLEINSTRTYKFIVPTFDMERKQRFIQFLSSPSTNRLIDRSFLTTETFEYERIIHDETQTFTGEIPKEWMRSSMSLPKYKKKEKVVLDQGSSLLQIAREMDKINPEGNWEEIVKPVQLIPLMGESQFSFDGLQHIAGGLASGKSTFQKISTYTLAKHHNAKVGIIENNVQSVLNTVKTYEQLGLKAIALIGKSDRVKHQEQRLRAYQFSSFDDIAEETVFEQVSDLCLIQALANDHPEGGRPFYPCKRLTEKGEKMQKLCPLSHLCGVYQNWSQLQDADIWVTTSAALLQTKIPKMIDLHERLLYEAMYDLLDVVFVDEADEVQQQFDQTFIAELDLFGDERQLLERLNDDIHRLTKGKYELATNKIITNWRRVTNEVSEVIWHFYEILNNSMETRKYWENRILYVNYIIYDIASNVTSDERTIERIQEELRRFANQTILAKGTPMTGTLELFLDQPLRVENQEEIDHWLQTQGIDKRTIKNLEQFYMKFTIFIILSYIERAMTYFVHSYPLLPESIQREIDFPYLQKHEAFRPYIEEAMTGVMYGYRYVKNEGDQHGQIKLVQYTAVGRNLLYKWPSLYKYAKGKMGPAVVLLSGTSYAPKSMHYHVEHTPNWLITSTRQTSSLTQFILPLHDPTNEERPIAVSGTGIGPVRDRHLYALTMELEEKIGEELSYWENKGEKRRVLLVVNSYEDAKVVGRALDHQEKWKDDYRILTRDEQFNEQSYSRPLIERFSTTEEQILVVPLLSVGRGYNIMDEQEDGALFGTVFFLIRPYPIPNDLGYYVQVLHGKLPTLLEDIQKSGLQYGKAMRKIRGESRKLLLKMFRYPDFWKRLSEEERLILAWYTFIPVWQMIGRLLRGGKDARVFYCDAKFHQATEGVPTLIDYWKTCMAENDDDVFNHLYGPFKESILNIKDEGMIL